MVVEIDYEIVKNRLLDILKNELNKKIMSSSIVKIVYRYRSDFKELDDKINFTYDKREKYNRTKNVTVELDKNLSHDEIIKIAVDRLKFDLGYKIEVVKSSIDLTLF